MKIENLHEGQTIKNYKELCTLLEIKPTTGKSKQIQLKEFDTYFTYHKDGFKFVIDNIITTKIKAKEVKGKYINEIQYILTDYIYKNREIDGTVLLSFSKLIEILGLANKTYNVGNSKKAELSEILNIELVSIYYFYNNTRNEFKQIIERALKNLERRSVIRYSKQFMIAFKNHDKDGKYYLTYRKATKEETKNILNAQKIALQKLEVQDMKELFLKGFFKYKEFAKYVMEELPNTWAFYFNVYELIVGDKAISIEYENMFKEVREILNKKIIKRTNVIFDIEELEENNKEKQLIDKLINLINYDKTLDNKILALYEKKKKEKEQKKDENLLKLIELKREERKIQEQERDTLIDNMAIEHIYNSRDSIDEFDYYCYLQEKKNIKKKK